MQTLVQSENFSNERVVRFQLLNKRYVYPKHMHQFAELIIPLENELTISVDQRTETLKPGSAAFVFPFQPHSYESAQINKVAIFVFSPYMIPDFFNKTENRIGTHAVFTPKESTLAMFRDRIFAKSDMELFDMKGCIYLILSDFLEEVELCKSLAKNEMATAIVSYIREHITDEITLPAIAKALGYNPNYLSKCISDIFETNLCTLIANIRVDKARYLLYETDNTGLEICYECGFGSERSFHRQFKSVTGRTPKEYRNMFSTRGNMNNGTVKYF